MKKWMKPDTLTKKCSYLTLGIGVLMCMLIQAMMPSVFYQMMRTYISDNVTNVLRANTISQSYIWRGNKLAFNLSDDQDVRTILTAYYASEEDTEKKELTDELLKMLETQRLGYGSHQVVGEGAIVSISYPVIYTEKGDIFAREIAADEVSVLSDSGWLQEISADEDMIYSSVLGDELMQVICFAVPFRVQGLQCYAMHLMDFKYIHVLFEELEEMGIADYCMFQHDRLIYQNTEAAPAINSYPESMHVQQQYETSVLYQDDGMDFLTLVSYEGENLKIAVHAEKETLLAPYQGLMALIECLIIGIILLLVLLISLFINQQLKRLTALSQRINYVIEGKDMPLPEDRHQDEISSLTENFNHMMETIQADIERRVQHEKKEQEMQYSLLVSAIDPHFIYNTLNTVTFLAYMGNVEEIVKVNTALIGTLKDRLAIKNCKTYDTTMTEREILEQYMLIQSYLCHNTIEYYFEIEEGCEKLLVPKNIIQPLVENSIKHGLLPHKDLESHEILDGRISILARRLDISINECGKTAAQNQAIWMEIIIADNGVGISEEMISHYFTCPVSKITESEAEHIGICNIRKRLSYLYGENYELKVRETAGGGCTVILCLPVMEKEN